MLRCSLADHTASCGASRASGSCASRQSRCRRVPRSATTVAASSRAPWVGYPIAPGCHRSIVRAGVTPCGRVNRLGLQPSRWKLRHADHGRFPTTDGETWLMRWHNLCQGLAHMWTRRQRLQSAFRVTAAVVMSLWVVATLACAMHCAGLFEIGIKASGSCCRRVATVASASETGAAAHHQPSGPTKSGGSGCLKELIAGKPAPSTTFQGTALPQLAWLASTPVDQAARPSSCDRAGDRQRCSTPALMLGRGLRTLEPPSSLA